MKRSDRFLQSHTGCLSAKNPFFVSWFSGGNQYVESFGQGSVIEKFQKELLKWKANMLSIGDRLVLITLVFGSLGTYYMSLFVMSTQVKKCLESI